MTTTTSKSVCGRDGHWYTLVKGAVGYRLKARTDDNGDMHYAGGLRWTRQGIWFATPEEAVADLGSETSAALLQSVRARLAGDGAEVADMTTVSDELTALRERAGLTQAECARLLGVPRQNWNRWERGRAMPLAARMDAIRRRLTAIADRSQRK